MYEVIGTGSTGNAVVIADRILIDCGVPYKRLKPIVQRLSLVLLTHEHGDHFQASTLRRLAQERPTLRFGTPAHLIVPLLQCGVPIRSIDVIEPNETKYDYGPFSVRAFPLPHNVPNCGYKLEVDGKRILYATDTNSMQHVSAKDYDLYLLEANYSEDEIVQRIKDKQEIGQYCYEWEVLNNHLSTEKANNWLYSQMGPRSEYVYLHGHDPGGDANA